jgi:hypothetical protein
LQVIHQLLYRPKQIRAGEYAVGRKIGLERVTNCLKQGDAFSPLLFIFALVYAIMRVHVNQDGLKLNGKHQLMVYADDVNILSGSVKYCQENTQKL